jgi:thioredoxin reductase (NADPH)
MSAPITELKRDGGGFIAKFGEQQVQSRFVLLATGIVDESPNLPGIKVALANGSIRYCPVCDGYEAMDQRVGVLGHGEDASSEAKFLRTYSNDVTLLRLDERSDNNEKNGQVASQSRCKSCGASLSHRTLRRRYPGSPARWSDPSFDVVYPALGCGVRSELAVALGAKTNDVGCLEVDAHQQTTAEGVYAAGDVVSDLHQIAVATGHAAIAATHIHKSLPENYKGLLDDVDHAAA